MNSKEFCQLLGVNESTYPKTKSNKQLGNSYDKKGNELYIKVQTAVNENNGFITCDYELKRFKEERTI